MGLNPSAEGTFPASNEPYLGGEGRGSAVEGTRGYMVAGPVDGRQHGGSDRRYGCVCIIAVLYI